MTTANGIGGLALCAAILGAGLAPPDAAKPRTIPEGGLGERWLDVCVPPLNHEDAVLDESTDLYVPAASRASATAAAIDLAIGLRLIHREYQLGHLGPAYDAHVGQIQSLAGKQAEVDHATSAEIRSLKRVRAALYADAVEHLRACAEGAPSQGFLAAYRAREAVLDGVILRLSSVQPMRPAERRAVCHVLALR